MAGRVVKDVIVNGLYIKSYYEKDVQYKTKSFVLWESLKARCKEGGKYQENKPSYIGCSVSTEFLDYQYFARWCNSQIGYDIKDYHLDKDLLLKGNRIYGEEYCVFIPRNLNAFLTAPGNSREGLQRGVHIKGEKFAATISLFGKTTHIGCYTRLEDAVLAYKSFKEGAAKEWAKILSSSRNSVDTRVIDSLLSWRA